LHPSHSSLFDYAIRPTHKRNLALKDIAANYSRHSTSRTQAMYPD
jgi:hypothetical protein